MDAPELISTFLAAEADATCRRNAFIMLCHTARERAVEYLEGMWETVGAMEEGMQLALIELIRMECRGENSNRVSCFVSEKRKDDRALWWRSSLIEEIEDRGSLLHLMAV